jgi:hypothetical protein
MIPTIFKGEPEVERRWFWHWQNLNERKDGTHGSGWREGRCWWHFRSRNRRPGPDICFSWNLWSSFFGVSADIDDEDLTFMVAVPPFSFWLSFSTNFWLVDTFAPKKVLSPNYPDTIVIDEREILFRIHSGSVWLKFWGPRDDWTRTDPWWKRGVNFSINPFERKFQKHEVRRADGSWAPCVGYWDHGKDQPITYSGPDGREVFIAVYRYVLNNGTVQRRIATYCIERREWRPRCLQWTDLFAKVRTCIDVNFSDEVGERSGSWKGGCTGCGWELLPTETPEQCLRRMERERKF